MPGNKTIVRVNTFFYTKEELFSFIRRFAQYSDDRFAYWDDFAFTTEEIPECDALLVFNNPSEVIKIICNPAKLIAFMMEPGVRSEHPWMFAGLEQYSKVYSPIMQSSNTVLSHGYLGWHLHQNRQFLNDMPVPEKIYAASCIASDLTHLKGQKQRYRFINFLKAGIPGIHYYGKGSNYINDKSQGLFPYRYSIAIENTSIPHYFTEKINDCFLAYCIPLYFGCTNIEKYFPERSFIRINIHEPEKTIRQIQDILANDDWNARLDALKEARHLVLNKYQPLAGAAQVLKQVIGPDKKEQIIVKPVPPTWKKRISIWINRVRK